MPVVVSNLCKRFGGTVAADDVSFTLEDGKFLALLGPSGSGKTTVLRMLAGLEQPDSGAISIHDRVVFGDNRDIPAEERDIGMVFQDYALWPHMTVADNIEFGLRLRRLPRAQRAQRISEVLALVHLPGLERRFPDQLSGGQQQRVAIARAMATQPRLLLLDEPLSNLDAALREEMRIDMVRLLKDQGITSIYVTHDRVEALAMADEIVVMREGKIAQVGSPEDVYLRPANKFIASFLGLANFLPGTIVPAQGAPTILQFGDRQLVGTAHLPVSGAAIALLRPEDGSLHAAPPNASHGNILNGSIVYSEFLGGRWRHVIRLDGDHVIQVMTPERAPSSDVWITFPHHRCLLLPPD